MDGILPRLGRHARSPSSALGAVTAISRNVFLWSQARAALPRALQRALQMAPLAAIVAVTAPGESSWPTAR